MQQQSAPAAGANIKGLALMVPNLKVWTGGVAFDRDRDCPTAKGVMPPRDLVRDGLLMLVKDKVLNPFLARRKRIERAANDAGYRLSDRGGVWAMTESKAIELLPTLNELYQEWQQEIATLAAALPQHYADREAETPAWSSILKAGQIPPAQIGARFRFNISFLPNGQMQALDQALQAGVGDPMADDHARMLLESVARDARELLEGALATKAQVTQTTLNAVRALMKKLHEYAFLASDVEAVYDCWEPILSALPRVGVATEHETFLVKSMLEVLKSPELAVAYALRSAGNQAGEDAALIAQHAALVQSAPQQTLAFAMAGAA